MVTINAWNEWIEGSYLLPDRLNGFGYLEAVKRELDAHARRTNIARQVGKNRTTN